MLLGIMALAGSGKDTAADYLVDKYDFVKMSMADEMKRTCKRVYRFSDEQLWGPSHMRNAGDRRYPIRLKCKYQNVRPFSVHICSEDPDCWEYLSPRVALQTLGTEWGRNCYINTWVDVIIRDAQEVMEGVHYDQQRGLQSDVVSPKPRGVVVPDVRFQNELDAIHKAGGKVLRLVRPGIVAGQVGVKGHASEMEQGSIPDSALDAVLVVEEGIENFQKQLDAVMSSLLPVEDDILCPFCNSLAEEGCPCRSCRGTYHCTNEKCDAAFTPRRP